MQQFRTVRCDMWRKDDWFADLQPDAKLVWIYTFTNDSTSPAGIYRIALRTIANDTGLPYERVKEIIAEFQTAGKLAYEDGIIWPITMRKHQVGELNPKDNLAKRIANDLADLPDREIVARYKQHYSQTEPPTNPLQRESEGPTNALPVNRIQDTGYKRQIDDLAPLAPDDDIPPEVRAINNAYDSCGLMVSKTHMDAHFETIRRTGLTNWQRGWAAAADKGKQNVPSYVARCAESAMLDEQKSRSNGNGRITDYTTEDKGDWLPEKPAKPDQSEQIDRILAVLRPRLRLEVCTAMIADDGALVLSVASQDAAEGLKQHSNLIANTVAQHIQTRNWRCEVAP